MQILKHLNLFERQHIYYDYLNFMGTLQLGNGLGILSILVIVFLDLDTISIYYEKIIIMNIYDYRKMEILSWTLSLMMFNI